MQPWFPKEGKQNSCLWICMISHSSIQEKFHHTARVSPFKTTFPPPPRRIRHFSPWHDIRQDHSPQGTFVVFIFLFILHLFYSCNFNFPLIFPLSSFFTFSPFFSTLFHISPSSNNISQYFPPRPGGGRGGGYFNTHSLHIQWLFNPNYISVNCYIHFEMLFIFMNFFMHVEFA